MQKPQRETLIFFLSQVAFSERGCSGGVKETHTPSRTLTPMGIPNEDLQTQRLQCSPPQLINNVAPQWVHKAITRPHMLFMR